MTIKESVESLAKSNEPSAPVGVHAEPPVAPKKSRKRTVVWIVGAVILCIVAIATARWIMLALNTVSTDDAYVNGHVTFVAARVPGQVMHVLVDDNNRVRKGDVLVQLDKEPYQVQVNIAKSALAAAQSDLVAAQAQARATAGQARSLRYALDHAIEDVDNQIALLHSKVATLNSRKASLDKAQADFDRAAPLVRSGAVAQENLDLRREALLVAKAQADEALQEVYEVRASLGLPREPEGGGDLTQVKPNLDQDFSAVRQAEQSLIQAVAQLGVSDSFDKSPKQLLADFYKRDPSGNIDVILNKILVGAPGVKQAQSKLVQAQSILDQALLNLRYCDVVAEIDGVITRRNVNPGNNVIAGQSLMAIRSLTDIWIDANFKETQLRNLRIGQPVDLDVDMYGSRHRFQGRISGFTFGTGSTLALLPAENATGNFVKVVQRLPVRIDLIDYDPDQVPLFIGLSVTPTVHLNGTLTGPNAGKFLQPYATTPVSTALSSPETRP
jgi:membrane fusion protein (multidrug efflux system)